MHKIWNKSLDKLSGNLMTNAYMPKRIKDALLDEDHNLRDRFVVRQVKFPKLRGKLSKMSGFEILAGLQKMQKKDCLTVFRAIRFPTNKRMFETISSRGCTMPNLEQERILELYRNREYLKKRKKIQSDHIFWVQPQERVVDGLPVFRLVNDAIQIHHAFRHEFDKVLVIVMFVPFRLIKKGRIKLVSNSAIDLDYKNAERDFEIKDYKSHKGKIEIDLEALNGQGIDLHEMYLKNLPWDKKTCESLGLKHDYFLLDIHRIADKKKFQVLREDTKVLIENSDFLHGFFGDQNIFARRESRYLPIKCYKIKRKKR